MYSSPLWDLFGKEAQKLYNQWNVLVRTIWGVSRETHRNLIEPLSSTTHLKNVLLCRFINFIKSLLKHEKESVRFLANLTVYNTETASGKNLKRIKLSTNNNILNYSNNKTKHNFPKIYNLPKEDNWKPFIIRELVEVVKGYSKMNSVVLPNIISSDNFSTQELEDLLTMLCCS